MAMIGRKPPSAFARFMLGSDEINARETAANQQAAAERLAAAIRARQMPIMSRGTMGPGVDGKPVGQVIPQDQRRRGVPTLRDVGPEVFDLIGSGADARQYVDTLDKMGPKLSNMNGWAVDERDSGNAGKYFGDAPTKGAEPLLDQRGNHVGWKLMDGTMEALGKAAYAEAYGKGRGGAPWEMVDVPDASGATRKMFKDDARAMGSDFRGQSPADAIRANAAATGEGEREQARQARVATADRQLDVLNNMEKLLPDVISGFGADAKLQGYRALAATGNAGASRKVMATETFLNQGRELVQETIKSFGANPTEGERKFAERMSGADAELNPATLQEAIRLRRERIQRDKAAAGIGGGGSMRRPGSAVRTQGQGFRIVEVLP